jgi:hypothetical protein
MIHRVPFSDRVIFLPEHCGDTVINLAEYDEVSEELQQEDIVKIGNYTGDIGGTGTIAGQEVNNQGLQKDMGIYLDSAGEVSYLELNDRGNVIANTRQRDKLVTIE